MQIHEITKLEEGMLSDVVFGALNRALGGRQASPEKMAQANQAAINSVAKKAYPMWLAKREQLAKTMQLATPDEYNEELEAWIEDNLLRQPLRSLDDADPRYKTAIEKLIQQVNNQGISPKQREEFFNQLVATSVMARPSRAQAGAVRMKGTAQGAIQAAAAFSLSGQAGNPQSLQNFGNALRQNMGVTSVSRSDIAKYGSGMEQQIYDVFNAGGIQIT